MIVAIVDTETDSLSIQDAKILELAIVIYDTEARRALSANSFLIRHDNLYVSKEITEINGITAKMCMEHGDSLLNVMNIFAALVYCADMVIAHNGGSFDFPLIERHVKFSTPKIDSKTDIKWPARHTSKRLLHLAADYGCTMLNGHQALNDCLILLDLLIKVDQWDNFADIIRHREKKLTLINGVL